MDVSEIPVLQNLVNRMRWLHRRQRVLAENIANANTPGYRSKDLDAASFASAMKAANGSSLSVAKTNQGHIGGGQGAQAVANARPIEDPVDYASPSGNAVNMPEQMMKMTDTQMDYGMATTLYRKHVSLIRIALGRGR